MGSRCWAASILAALGPSAVLRTGSGALVCCLCGIAKGGGAGWVGAAGNTAGQGDPHTALISHGSLWGSSCRTSAPHSLPGVRCPQLPLWGLREVFEPFPSKQSSKGLSLPVHASIS